MIKKTNFFKLFILLSLITNAQVYASGYGPLEAHRWYVMPKIGVAPGIFSNRGHEQVAVPALATPFDCVINCPEDDDNRCREKATNQEGTILQNQCETPKFSSLWSNGVLHVGGEVGFNSCDNGQWFVDLFYNRASGSCFSPNNKYILAPDGCNNDCCDETVVFEAPERQDNYENYSAFGAYLGHRHYFSRVWCENVAFFVGAKFGLQRRQKVAVSTVTPEHTVSLVSPDGQETFNNLFAERTECNTFVCKSTAVSGGLQLGGDYCINDCLSLLIGVEVQATCPFKLNNNIRVSQATPTVDGEPTTQGRDIVPQITNINAGRTGAFVQFPVWAALRWEFDWCNPCSPCA